jgi:hypothetical protein
VQTTVGGCVSTISDTQVLVVTATQFEPSGSLPLCYPNPAENKMTIQCSNTAEVSEVEITNVQGLTIRSGGRELLNTPITCEGFEAGVYLVRIKSGVQVLTGKFVKK